MVLALLEWFGHSLSDTSPAANADRVNERCPFIGGSCSKTFNDNTKSGVCSVIYSGENVVICANRMYERQHKILQDVAEIAFGEGVVVQRPDAIHGSTGDSVVAFGHGSGRELRLPNMKGSRSFFVDWILAKVSPNGTLLEFVAVEVQTIDTTGSYRDAVVELRSGNVPAAKSNAGLNWENVNKRIIPQLLYKGHVLRREARCSKGLFFVCPTPVYARIQERIGEMQEYTNLQPGSLTFCFYEMQGGETDGHRLEQTGTFSTTVDQLAWAFVSPQNLPPAGSYETAINTALSDT